MIEFVRLYWLLMVWRVVVALGKNENSFETCRPIQFVANESRQTHSSPKPLSWPATGTEKPVAFAVLFLAEQRSGTKVVLLSSQSPNSSRERATAVGVEPLDGLAMGVAPALALSAKAWRCTKTSKVSNWVVLEYSFCTSLASNSLQAVQTASLN